MITEGCCHLHVLLLLVSLSLSASSSLVTSASNRVRMSTPQRSERSVVTVDVTVENTDGPDTGHVVLGVLGGLALVLFLVAILVPIIRWRKRSGSSTQSRASSRRTHTRIVSEYNQDAVAPLLEEQPGGMAVNEGAPMVTQSPRMTPSRPPTAMLNWKILQTLPNFDDESNESSLGKPLEPGERTFPEGDTGVRLVDADRRSAALPPIPGSDGPSRASTMVATTTPTSPLLNAFQNSVTPSISDTFSHTNSVSTFRYPSLASSSSKSTAPTLEAQAAAQNTSKSPAYTPSPSWVPRSLVPGSESSAPSETWSRIPSMPPIPESVGSASISSFQHKPEAKNEPPPPAARLRDSNASAGPSTIRHVRGSSGEAGTQGSLSRSSTQHTDRSITASLVERDERRTSTLTHGTFGRHGHPDSRDSSYARPSEADGSGLVSPSKPEEKTMKHVKRRTFDFPREPSPPLTPAPLSAPPPPHSLRPGNPSRSTRPSSQPVPDPQSPQSPEDPEPETGPDGPYGHNEEASSSSEQLLPSTDLAPLLPELPSLPQLSPLAFEFKLDAAAASRSNSASTESRSRKSDKGKSKGRGHAKSPSKASTASAVSSGTGSKRSLRSLASFSSIRTGSSGSHSKSRSKSRERGKHSRRVTFGDESSAPPVPLADVPSGDTISEPRETPQRQASRPLPTLPATLIAGYSVPSPRQVSSDTTSNGGGYDVH